MALEALRDELASYADRGPTMSSLEIAELTGRPHEDVWEEIRTAVVAHIWSAKDSGVPRSFERILYLDKPNMGDPYYVLTWNEWRYLVGEGYSLEDTAIVTKRFGELVYAAIKSEEAAEPEAPEAPEAEQPTSLLAFKIDIRAKVRENAAAYARGVAARAAADSSPPSLVITREVFAHPGKSGYHDNSLWVSIGCLPDDRRGIWLTPGQSLAVVTRVASPPSTASTDREKTMSSLEIAEICSMQHRDVVADICAVLGHNGELFVKSDPEGDDGQIRSISYDLPLRECAAVTIGYSGEHKDKLDWRWAQMLYGVEALREVEAPSVPTTITIEGGGVDWGGAAGKTMSSLEIAELTGKEHKHVMRDIRSTLEEAGIPESKFGRTYHDAQNKERTCYHLPRFECDLVVSGYSVKYRAAIIRRWHDLEEQAANNARSIHNRHKKGTDGCGPAGASSGARIRAGVRALGQGETQAIR